VTDKTHDKELNALKADIASLRQEIAKLVVGVKKSVGINAEQQPGVAQLEDFSSDEEGHGVWSDLLHKFGSSKIQGKKIVSTLATEVEQHPLGSLIAAFGIGYIIAKLWYHGNKK
jgi:hypothetical protein